MAAYGNHKIQAPNLNKLAGQSVVFQHAYVSQPVCTPSRSTVLTGLWPHTTGCTNNNIPLPVNVPTFPELLRDADYRTGYFGKWHLGDEIFPQHGFEEWVSIEDGYRKYYSAGRDLTAKSSYHHFLLDLGYTPDTDGGDFSRGFAARLPIEHCKPAFLERAACDFLGRHRKEPFVLYVNFLEPHMPFTGPLNGLHDPAAVDLPKNFDDPLEENEPLRYRLLREEFYRKGFGGIDLKTEAGWRRLIANYWGLVSQVDRSVGKILTTLEDLGLAENTVVVYTSDHGDMMGAHRLLAKTVMYEESVRVPLLLRIPQFGFGQRMIPGRVSHIDLVPTLLDLMDKSVPAALPGKSLRPVITGGRPLTDPVFVEWNPAIEPDASTLARLSAERDVVRRAVQAHIRAVITQDGWKLCLSSADKSQLFFLQADPYESTNLFDSGKHGEVIGRLSESIHGWQEKVGDTVRV